jgi:hypothetical protein
MQRNKSSVPEADIEEDRKALKRAWEAKRPNPHRRALERIKYYVVTGRIRSGIDPVGTWPPKASEWALIQDGSIVELYGVNEKKVLAWFIDLAKKGDLTKLSPADILALQEESHALQARGIPEVTEHGAGVNEPLSLAGLIELQTEVRKRIDEFFATNEFTFLGFTPTILIKRDPQDHRCLIDYEFLPPFHSQGLLYLFATLLRRVRLPIERCPWCQQIFLPSRKDAEHCSRPCQAAHFSQRIRSNKPPGKRGRPRKLPELRQAPTKGVKTHGKK